MMPQVLVTVVGALFQFFDHMALESCQVYWLLNSCILDFYLGFGTIFIYTVHYLNRPIVIAFTL